eukprot:SAG31_NODE_23246_length_508_cov_0.762836_1_plen_43_part_00
MIDSRRLQREVENLMGTKELAAQAIATAEADGVPSLVGYFER